MSFDLGKYGRQLLDVVIVLITVAIAYGIGKYIVVELNNGTNNSLSESVNMFGTQVGYVNMALTFLFIGIVAIVGIGLVKMLSAINKTE